LTPPHNLRIGEPWSGIQRLTPDEHIPVFPSNKIDYLVAMESLGYIT